MAQSNHVIKNRSQGIYIFGGSQIGPSNEPRSAPEAPLVNMLSKSHNSDLIVHTKQVGLIHH